MLSWFVVYDLSERFELHEENYVLINKLIRLFLILARYFLGMDIIFVQP